MLHNIPGKEKEFGKNAAFNIDGGNEKIKQCFHKATEGIDIGDQGYYY